jgi:hypothetical protein
LVHVACREERVERDESGNTVSIVGVRIVTDTRVAKGWKERL